MVWSHCTVYYIEMGVGKNPQGGNRQALLYFYFGTTGNCINEKGSGNIKIPPYMYKLHGKCRAYYKRSVARQYDICWLKKELSVVHGILYIFLAKKRFCLSRQKAEIFSICLRQAVLKIGFLEFFQNAANSAYSLRQHYLRGIKLVRMS